MKAEVLQGDVRERLAEMRDESVHCVVTSPPYWGLRDYGLPPMVWGNHNGCEHEWTEHWQPNANAGGGITPKQRTNEGSYQHSTLGGTIMAKSDGPRGQLSAFCSCGAWRGCLGLEPTPELFVQHLVEIFREVKRVLRKDGTLWLNLGDSYSGSGKGRNPDGTAHHAGFESHRKQSTHKGILIGNVEGGIVPNGCKPKDLVGIPWMVAFALRSDGWYLRSDIIWAKPNPMPESVTDRPTKSHEYIFLLTKSRHYFFDQEAVKEIATSTDNSVRDRKTTKLNNTPGRSRMGGLTTNGYYYRNIRSVWNVATQPFSEAHFATFPEDLVKRCLLAGTSTKGVCTKCGAPWVRVLDVKPIEIDRSERTHELGRTRTSGTMTQPRESDTIGWEPTCKCAAGTVPPTVLDPFCGSGTTGVVANQLGCDFIGIELNPQYQAMAKRRLAGSNEQHTLYEALL